MKRLQSLFIASVLTASLLSFSFGLFFARNIETNIKESGTSTFQTPPGKITNNGIPLLQIKNIEEVWEKLREGYYDTQKLDLSKLTSGALKGFVAGIGDAYTVYLTPEESKDFENSLEGQLEGIGAELEVKNGKLIIVTPLKGSPAEKAGLKSGDIILKIDGMVTEELTLFDAIRRIRGRKGTTVTLTILRENIREPIDIKITRREISLENITFQKLEGNLFHMSIHQFNDHSRIEFQRLLEQILLEKAQGLILDMRGNGGGYLDISIDILSEFLAGEKPAAIIKKRDRTRDEVVKTTGNAKLLDIPLVILVDRGSASASEIVAGAMQDYKRALVIGEKTFGKGSVQEIVKLKDGSLLRMTVAKWFTPLNRSIDEVGITPDIVVKMTEMDYKEKRDPQLEEAVKHLKTRKIM